MALLCPSSRASGGLGAAWSDGSRLKVSTGMKVPTRHQPGLSSGWAPWAQHCPSRHSSQVKQHDVKKCNCLHSDLLAFKVIYVLIYLSDKKCLFGCAYSVLAQESRGMSGIAGGHWQFVYVPCCGALFCFYISWSKVLRISVFTCVKRRKLP